MGQTGHSTLHIAMAQLNLLVGDIEGNAGRIIAEARRAHDSLGAEVVVFPELALTGYPPEDLLLRADMLDRVLAALERIRRQVQDVHLVVGHPWGTPEGVRNSATVIGEGKFLARCDKCHLPNYGVFDERRYFTSGAGYCVVPINGIPVGITICEDIWLPGPVESAVAGGARLVFSLNASPFHLNKGFERHTVVAQRARGAGVPLLYTNLVGGQDELVFDGGSFVVDGAGNVTQQAEWFEEALVPVEIALEPAGARPLPGPLAEPLSEEASAYAALLLGLRDYVDKNGFPGVVLGLSGGIDSALSLALAVDALGAERVEALLMPSRYTADMSVEDARQQADLLGVRYRIVGIEPLFRAFLDALSEPFAGLPADTTEENLQARCRGVLLMALSNKTHKMVLTTGNKSELAVGYSTLYGDMAGGFDVLKDVPKTLVYRLARYRNRLSPAIPERVIERPPSAELAPDQKDSDSLPEYPELDAILERYVERDEAPAQIVGAGYDPEVVRRVVALVDRNEYKRRQAPPGVRITRRAFGRDRRYPITSGYGRHST